MKLWLLQPVDGDTIWRSWYDKVFGFVVRAETEAEARLLVSRMREPEPENDLPALPAYAGEEGVEAWLDPQHSTCVELKPEGATKIILRDFRSA